MTAFERGVDGLKAIRNPGSFAAEHEAIKVPEDTPPDRKEVIQRFAIYAKRARPFEKAFEEVRLAGLLCGLHISKEAAEAVASLIRIRQKVLGPPEYIDPEIKASHHRKYVLTAPPTGIFD